MSGTQTDPGDGGGNPPPAAGDDEVIRVARANGWRPQEEFKGPPDRWVPADVFVARGLENPAMLRDRNQVLTERLTQMERTHAKTRTDLESKLDETLDSLKTVTAMTRSAETRAYDRARRELKAEQETAVANADTDGFRRAEVKLEELERTKPAEPPPAAQRTQTPNGQAAPPANGAAAPPPQEALQFFAANPWYHADLQLQRAADRIHIGLKEDRPDISLGDNLREVERQMRLLYPDRAVPARASAANGHDDDPTPRRGQRNNGEDDRRDDPPAVTPSSGGTPPRSRNQRFTFDAMPKESKDAYTKYATQLEGKGDPLTKEEWAETYWSQFRDDGA